MVQNYLWAYIQQIAGHKIIDDAFWLLLGNLHEVLVELEGMGGGGKIQLEVTVITFLYRNFWLDQVRWWNGKSLPSILHCYKFWFPRHFSYVGLIVERGYLLSCKFSNISAKKICFLCTLFMMPRYSTYTGRDGCFGDMALTFPKSNGYSYPIHSMKFHIKIFI